MKIMLAAATAILTTTAANALTVTYATDRLDLTLFRGPASRLFDLPQFDPALGTLTKVTGAISQKTSGDGYIENLTNFSVPALTIGNTGYADLYLPNGGPIATTASWQSEPGAAAPFDGVADFAGPSTVHGFGLGLAAQSADIADLTGYVGTGTIGGRIDTATLLPEGYSVQLSGGQPFFAITINDHLEATASVTYTYDAPAALPEPASWALLVTGFGLVGTAVRPRAVAAA